MSCQASSGDSSSSGSVNNDWMNWVAVQGNDQMAVDDVWGIGKAIGNTFTQKLFIIPPSFIAVEPPSCHERLIKIVWFGDYAVVVLMLVTVEVTQSVVGSVSSFELGD
ncbi:hypothetical protein L195_g023508 [Trifolium pratense]|uniref:Uncharacterized protein n=1 Tax=Trifolium pratense TaxID=57577 RepID=A0A2K3NB14_TRIPR|nr:hypothetical protein L195_g023508 [Trifolium pratense]